MNNLKSILLCVLTITTITTYAQKDAESVYYVNSIHGDVYIDGHQVLYSLPKNSLAIELKICRTEYVKGPYAEFAEKYLNITSGIIDETKITYELVDVKVDRYSHPDTSQFYAINFVGNDNLPMLQLNNDGTIIACNSKSMVKGYEYKKIKLGSEPPIEPLPFYDMGVKPFTYEEEIKSSDTTDTISAVKTELVVSTPEENAYQAAAFIRKIRKRRLKLIAGISDKANAVDGKALKAMVKELDDTEKDYIELFTGRKRQTTYKQTVTFTPSAQGTEQQIIGYLSESNGFTVKNTRRPDAAPITIKVQPITNSPKVDIKAVETSAKSTAIRKYGVYYRIPATTIVTVDYNNETQYNNTFTIAQKGIVVPLPTEYLNNQKYSIEFDAETGALKRISSN